MSQIRTVIADDHDLIRSALIPILEDGGRIKVVSSVGNAADAIDATVDHAPDVVVMDIQMPGLDCFHAAEEIRRIQPDVRIVILSGDYNDRYIESALRVDARAYVTKADPIDHVVKAIETVMRGKRYFSPSVQERVNSDRVGQVTPLFNKLSDRERATLRYLAEGWSKKEIANELHVSVKTIEKHTQSIMDKLEVHDRVRLSLWYVDYIYKSDNPD
ncbi:MAG: response regulator transcription factor [Phycisphaerales bacterium]|nr:response regulator transcription factor [Phycisphaerales bacterium]